MQDALSTAHCSRIQFLWWDRKKTCASQPTLHTVVKIRFLHCYLQTALTIIVSTASCRNIQYLCRNLLEVLSITTIAAGCSKMQLVHWHCTGTHMHHQASLPALHSVHEENTCLGHIIKLQKQGVW